METLNLEKIKLYNEISRFIVNANDEIKMKDTLIYQGDTKVFSLGDISVITGQPKSRKTFLVTALCAAFLSEKGYLGLIPGRKGKILLVDSEQSKSFVISVSRRIYRILKWDYNDSHKDEIEILTIRELSAKERMDVLEKAIIAIEPTLVIVDGFADLLQDTNSLEESTKRVSDLMRFSTIYDCHICSVVHTNPNSEKMRGHTGSELQRKAETVLLVTKSEEITTVSPQFCRNIEFQKFSFRINEDGLPVVCSYTPSAEDNNRILFESIFMSNVELCFTDLKNEVKRRLAIKDTAAESRIKKAVEAGIITKNIKSEYILKYDQNIEINNY